MAVPSKADISKRKKKLETWLKGLEEDGSMSEKKLCTLLRSAVRNVWMRHPVKLSYLYSKTYPDMNNATRTKWLIDCEHCNKSFKTGDVQVDHIIGEHSLLTLEDVVPFAESILGVSHEDLRILCIPCHEAITYAERYNMTIEEAFEEKKVIVKIKQTVAKQKSELKKFGYKASDMSNNDKRRELYRELLKLGKI
ncbi:homing endonuclease HNH [Pseudoalteromonas phage J2-1]|uniref:Homing endonuclease HNH n=1 Tax=Pseudoalteromonas phage J2-1 TaxID=2023998 RepID=A0A223LH04_9CAUD|nr:HNH endonuclease [Pseudoalteromonas phage J2-1]ASU03311.1 homing endonuclease HNH [Pseudoalteromonas phage J2-1]